MTAADRERGGQRGALRALAVLPARLGSTRLARKMLLEETGTPLVVHTAERVRACPAFERVIVATDTEEILEVVKRHGLEAVLTDPRHASGTDRVHEAASSLDEHFDVVVNVQADEPEVDPADLGRLIEAFAEAAVLAATLRYPIRAPEELADPSVVKVVCDGRGDALYFSRSPIPSRSHARPGHAKRGNLPLAWRHLGVYAWRPQALASFCALPPGELEECESLEQLRWLENGGKMRLCTARSLSRGVDTLEDYAGFVARHATQRQGKR